MAEPRQTPSNQASSNATGGAQKSRGSAHILYDRGSATQIVADWIKIARPVCRAGNEKPLMPATIHNFIIATTDSAIQFSRANRFSPLKGYADFNMRYRAEKNSPTTYGGRSQDIAATMKELAFRAGSLGAIPPQEASHLGESLEKIILAEPQRRRAERNGPAG